jgi:hypothetical protein
MLVLVNYHNESGSKREEQEESVNDESRQRTKAPCGSQIVTPVQKKMELDAPTIRGVRY